MTTFYTRQNLIVVARFQEDINPWINDFKNQVVVYNKHSGPNLLPNVGREAHTYLHFIIDNYHKLPDVTVFCQGDIFKHVQESEYSDILRLVTQHQHTNFHSFGFSGDTEMLTFQDYIKLTFFSDLKHVIPEPRMCHIREYQAFDCELEYDTVLVPLSIYPTHLSPCVFGAHFAVSRERILLRTKSWYESIIKLVDWHMNPLGAHFFERVWPFVFGEALPFRLVSITSGEL